MKKVVIVPDSFKGTLSTGQICRVAEEVIRRHMPRCQVVKIPVADGGEGSVDALLQALGGQKERAVVQGPYFEEMESFYGLLKDGSGAVIEMAACAGLPLVEGRADPGKTTTYGVGQLMRCAVERGCDKLILALGGSCTNDGGCGAAAAAGVRFYNGAGETFVPTGDTLEQIADFDTEGLDQRLKEAQIRIMCDIDNPMVGPNGAAAVFAPQKGADEAQVRRLERGLCHLNDLWKKKWGRDFSTLAGGGAAGAMGAGMAAFFGGRLQRGIDVVLDSAGFDRILQDTDLVITGEGNLDSQSLHGKTVSGVARRAKERNVPVLAVVGGAQVSPEEAAALGVSAVFSINRMPEDLSVSRHKAEENLRYAMDNIMRLIKIFEK